MEEQVQTNWGVGKMGSWEDSDMEIVVETLEPRLGAEDRVTMKLD